jgi:hypothetical protein
MTSPDSHRALMRRFLRRTVLSLVVLGVILFGAAGTLDWPEAWVYLALTAVMSFGFGAWLGRHDPALLAERLGSLIQRDQKRWDKILMVIMLALWTGLLILIGLDAKRFHWSDVPLAAHKVNADATQRGQIMDLTEVYRARIVDVGTETLIIEITGESEKIGSIIEVLEPFGILEIMRTGKIAMTRGVVKPRPELAPAAKTNGKY